MNTADFPFFELPFRRFNVAQRAVVPFLDKDVNLVVAFSTAVGKTALAECIFGYHLTVDQSCKVIYCSPYKSLSNEKYRNWKENKQFSKQGILLSTGDYIASAQEFHDKRMILATAESLDSKTRNFHHKRWLGKVACAVFDEAHLLANEQRGGKLEAAIMRLSELSPEVRFILLSATMTNAVQLAKWIKSLNGKQTKCVQSDWRPSKVEMTYHEFDDSVRTKKQIYKAVELVKKQIGYGEKTVVFVHSKYVGSCIVEELKRNGIRSAFHNASVSIQKRKKIEEIFNDRLSGLDVLVSTSTLAAGVNIGT